MTAPRLPYVTSYEPKFATYRPKPKEASTQTTSASAPPGVSQRNRGWRTFGAIQNSSDSSVMATTASSGHFATDHVVRATAPAFTRSPTASVTGPLTISPVATTASSTSVTAAMPICNGRSR